MPAPWQAGMFLSTGLMLLSMCSNPIQEGAGSGTSLGSSSRAPSAQHTLSGTAKDMACTGRYESKVFAASTWRQVWFFETHERSADGSDSPVLTIAAAWVSGGNIPLIERPPGLSYSTFTVQSVEWMPNDVLHIIANPTEYNLRREQAGSALTFTGTVTARYSPPVPLSLTCSFSPGYNIYGAAHQFIELSPTEDGSNPK